MRSSLPLSRNSACVECRKKKQKCDAQRPCCGTCIKYRRTCVFGVQPVSGNPTIAERLNAVDTALGGFQENQPIRRPSISLEEHQVAELGQTNIPSSFLNFGVNDEGTLALIQAFIDNREQCYMDMHPARLMRSLSLPPSDPYAANPVFLDAILLMGSYFARSPSLAAYEGFYLESCLQRLSNPISAQSAVHDYVRASNLVIVYYLMKGLYYEAALQMHYSAQLAIACGLHQIKSSAWRQGSPPDLAGFLPFTQDFAEHSELIQTFWQTFCLDKLVAFVIGERPLFSDTPDVGSVLQIVTPLPTLLGTEDMVNERQAEIGSVSDLYTPSFLGGFRRDRTLAGLRVEGFSLLSMAMQTADPQDPAGTLALDGIIENYIAQLPAISDVASIPDVALESQLGPVNIRLAFIHSLGNASIAVLHQFGSTDASRARFGQAVHRIISIIDEMGSGAFPHMPIAFGYLWAIVGQILINVGVNAPGVVGEQYRRYALIISRTLRRLSLVYPPLGFHAIALRGHLPEDSP